MYDIEKFKPKRLGDPPILSNYDFYVEKEDREKSQLMRSKVVMNWLQKRYHSSGRMYYLKSRKTRKKEHLLQQIFHMVDADGSGTIDIDELYHFIMDNYKQQINESKDLIGKKDFK